MRSIFELPHLKIFDLPDVPSSGKLNISLTHFFDRAPKALL